MSDAPLPCPFCGNEPIVVGEDATCAQLGCPGGERAWYRLSRWNTRAPAAEPAVGDVHPGADAAHEFISFALLTFRVVTLDKDQDARRLGCGIGYLRQALDALRPPAAPVSVTFWLGREV